MHTPSYLLEIPLSCGSARFACSLVLACCACLCFALLCSALRVLACSMVGACNAFVADAGEELEGLLFKGAVGDAELRTRLCVNSGRCKALWSPEDEELKRDRSPEEAKKEADEAQAQAEEAEKKQKAEEKAKKQKASAKKKAKAAARKAAKEAAAAATAEVEHEAKDL